MDRLSHLFPDIASLVPRSAWRKSVCFLAWLCASSATSCSPSSIPQGALLPFEKEALPPLRDQHFKSPGTAHRRVRFSGNPNQDLRDLAMWALRRAAFDEFPKFLCILTFCREWRLVLNAADAAEFRRWAMLCVLSQPRQGAVQLLQFFQTWGKDAPIDCTHPDTFAAFLRQDENRLLRWAAESGNMDLLHFLRTHLTVGIYTGSPRATQRTPQMADVRSANNYALRMAAQNMHLPVLRLLQNWADPGLSLQDITQAGAHALSWAAMNDDVKVLQFFKEWRGDDSQYTGQSHTETPAPNRLLAHDAVIKTHALARAALHRSINALSFLLEWLREEEDAPESSLACVRVNSNALLRTAAKNLDGAMLRRLRDFGLTLADARQAWQFEMRFQCINRQREEDMLALMQKVWGPGVGQFRA